MAEIKGVSPDAEIVTNEHGGKQNSMREIKFRGKRLDNGKWVEGFYVYEKYDGRYKGMKAFENHYIYTGDIQYNAMSPYVAIRHKIDPETVGRYTGLKDKTGKAIYEGDIVEWDGQSMDTYKIIYGYDASFFGVPINGQMEQVVGESLSLLNADLGIVVVGTIHINGAEEKENEKGK